MRGCLVRIVFPLDVKLDEQLISLRGTGFFEPEVGAIVFTVEGNTIEFEACNKNYGPRKDGVIQFSKVRNQDYVHDFEESIKIYMTRDTDPDFEIIYQQISEGWIIKGEQQKPGLMTGTITATNLMVQSNTELVFDL
jgi:hypothetical protein